jgi:hypothetical protein
LRASRTPTPGPCIPVGFPGVVNGPVTVGASKLVPDALAAASALALAIAAASSLSFLALASIPA